jgi:aryl-alcohol dehydrogenase-like predicted oxidoreductase
MEFATISGTPLKVSRVGLGTCNRRLDGGTDEEESVKTIRASGTPASSRRLDLRR